MDNSDLIKEYKYEQSFIGSKVKLKEFIKKFELKLFSNKLFVEGNKVIIPSNKELHYKIKYDIDDNCSIGIKVTWKNMNEEAKEDVDENPKF